MGDNFENKYKTVYKNLFDKMKEKDTKQILNL